MKYLESSSAARDPSKVIAMSLHDATPSFTFGALRNVQQAPIFFPEWTVRIYVPSPKITQNTIPERLLNKMETLGAHVYYINDLQYPKEYLAFHIIQDKSVQAVLIRDPQFRLSDRQKSAVDEWMASASSMMHCMKDHHSHTALPIVPGLLGIKLASLRDNPQQYEKLCKILDEERTNGALEKRLREEFETVFMFHNSACCYKDKNCKPFPVVGVDAHTYEGQRYDEHMDPIHTPSS